MKLLYTTTAAALFGAASLSQAATIAGVEAALGNGTGVYLDGGSDENNNGLVSSTWTSANDDWNSGDGGIGEDTSDSALAVGTDILDGHTSATDGELTIAISGLANNQLYDVWAVFISHQGNGGSTDFSYGTTSGSLSTYNPGLASTYLDGTVDGGGGGTNTARLGGALVGQATSDGAGGLTLYVGENGNGTRTEFDGVLLEAVPEPSTTALLGLGGLALILRRRK